MLPSVIKGETMLVWHDGKAELVRSENQANRYRAYLGSEVLLKYR
jgi:hypothetical protein